MLVNEEKRSRLSEQHHARLQRTPLSRLVLVDTSIRFLQRYWIDTSEANSLHRPGKGREQVSGESENRGTREHGGKKESASPTAQDGRVS